MTGAITGFGSAIQFCCYGLYIWWGGYIIDQHLSLGFSEFVKSFITIVLYLSAMAIACVGMVSNEDATGTSERIFSIINRQSKIDYLNGDIR